MNERAREVVAHHCNSGIVSNFFDGSLVLDVRHYRSTSRDTLAVIGRDKNADIVVDGSNVSRVQCTFELIREINGIMLYDRSNGNTTHVFGKNATPFEDGRPRKVVVQKRLNTMLGIGGRGEPEFQFEIVWHFSPMEVSEKIKSWFAWNDQWTECSWLSRTTDDLEAVLSSHSYGYSGIISSHQNPQDRPKDTPLELNNIARPRISCGSSGNPTHIVWWAKSRPNRDSSRPYYRFDAQVSEAIVRLLKGVDDQTQLDCCAPKIEQMAHEMVKSEWMQQGIWCEEWKEVPQWYWMHEASYCKPSPCKEDTSTPEVPFFGIFGPRQLTPTTEAVETGSKSTQDPSSPEPRQTVDARASRPLYQFEYQMASELKDWMEMRTPMKYSLTPADINTRVYEKVKATWERRGI